MQREFRKLASSFNAAIAGLSRTVRTERNFRIHLCAVFYVLFFAWLGKIDAYYYPAIILCFGLVTGAEIINTVIELLCNVVSDRFDMMLKAIKDMAAGAVLVCALSSAAAGLYIFARPEIINNILISLFANPYLLALLLLSIPASGFFVLRRKRR